MDIWEQIKQQLSEKLSPESFHNWVQPSRFEALDGECLWVTTPSEAAKEWLEEEYPNLVASAVEQLHLPVRKVAYRVARVATVNGNGSHGAFAEPQFNGPRAVLNHKYTFETFVVGSCNQFAHAAALAVAQSPSRRYNPLFIYGGVGMGKTHLMHAIGNTLLERSPAARLVYTTSERFMNEMVSCIKLDRMPLFHRNYRSADVLLIDEIHNLAAKERTQEEFFHTFNELHENGKQIVITSDSEPKSISGLVERLRSRFEWGLMVDMQPPDLETKMAILDKKAEQEGIQLPEDVRILIATRAKSNVRELEGALVKLIALSSVTASPITMAMASQALKHLAGATERRVTIDAVIRAVAEYSGLAPGALKQKTNARNITFPRQVAMYIARDLTGASLPELGRVFGGKHHTTVLHSIEKIEALRQDNPDLDKMIHTLTDTIQGG